MSNSLDLAVIRVVRRRGGHAEKMASNAYKSGIPDVLACYRGRMLLLETKTFHDRIRATQKVMMLKFSRAECICAEIRSELEVPPLLDQIDREIEGKARKL